MNLHKALSLKQPWGSRTDLLLCYAREYGHDTTFDEGSGRGNRSARDAGRPAGLYLPALFQSRRPRSLDGWLHVGRRHPSGDWPGRELSSNAAASGHPCARPCDGLWLGGLVRDGVRVPVLSALQGQLGLGGSYFAGSGRQDGSIVFRQGYFRLKNIFSDTASSLRLGRFEFSDGTEVQPSDPSLVFLKRNRIAQRLIGPFGFSHIGRAFDGVPYTRSAGANNLAFVAARPIEGVFQLRSLYELDVDFYYGALTRQLSGTTNQGETRLFALHYHDGRPVLKTDNRPESARAAAQRNIRLTPIGGHAMGVFGEGNGKTDLLVWGAAQIGRWGALDHRAAAVAVEAGHQFVTMWKPWLRV